MRSTTLFAALVGFVVGFVIPAFFPNLRDSSQAGTAMRLSLEDAFHRSDLVIEGKVTGSACGVDENGLIYTDWTFDVDQTLWGAQEETRTIRMPGGVLMSGKGMMIPGMPRLVVGEDVLLLLGAPSTDGTRIPTGLSQGKYRIVTSTNGDRTAIQTGDHVSLITARKTRKIDGLGMLSYADLKARLEAVRQERSQTEFGTPREVK